LRPNEPKPTSILRVEPAGIEIEVRHGETLLQAAWRAGYYWPTLCFGVGDCNACHCEVLDGQHVTSPRTDAEVRHLEDMSRRVRRVNPRRIRLACQVTVSGDIAVRKQGVKVADPQSVPSAPSTEENVDVPGSS
jgi:ferredoxin, 2Fe-2S